MPVVPLALLAALAFAMLHTWLLAPATPQHVAGAATCSYDGLPQTVCVRAASPD